MPKRSYLELPRSVRQDIKELTFDSDSQGEYDTDLKEVLSTLTVKLQIPLPITVERYISNEEKYRIWNLDDQPSKLLKQDKSKKPQEPSNSEIQAFEENTLQFVYDDVCATFEGDGNGIF